MRRSDLRPVKTYSGFLRLLLFLSLLGLLAGLLQLQGDLPPVRLLLGQTVGAGDGDLWGQLDDVRPPEDRAAAPRLPLPGR